MNLTFSKKLYLCIGASVALTAVMAMLCVHTINDLGSQLDNVIEKTAKKQYLAADIDISESEMLANARGTIIGALSNDKALIEDSQKSFNAEQGKINSNLDQLLPLLVLEEGRRLVGEIREYSKAAAASQENVYRLASSGQSESAANELKAKTAPALLHVSDASRKLGKQQRTLMHEAKSDSEAAVSKSRWLTIFLIGLSAVVAIGVIFSVRHINQSLRQTVEEISAAALQTAAAASQVSSTSQSLAQGASELAASLEETSAASEQVNSMTMKNADNSKAATEVVTQSQRRVTETNQLIEQMVGSMLAIDGSSRKIGIIIKTIDEIAFQTNILALNASVEAARAGEAGLGFAVVADEVRNLAKRCAEAAKNTASLIDESVAKSGIGKAKVNEVAQAISEITEESSRIKALIEDVSQGTHEQSRGIDLISHSIQQMEQVTQQTAANAELGAAAAEELNGQSKSLKHVVARLASMVGST